MFVPVAMPRDVTVWYARKKKPPAFRQADGGCPEFLNVVFHFASPG